MYLAQLKVSNFRKLAEAELQFQPGLNVIVGANNVGKTAVVDALRALLAGHDEPYLETIKAIDGEKPVQLFVTSHSPNFASIVNLDSLTCLVNTRDKVETFFPRSISFGKGKREKLERYALPTSVKP